jgi:hypothetical protein
MDPSAAAQVLQAIPPAQRGRVDPPATDQPVATGTGQGDRYYVKATWDPKNPAVVECLTHFYNGVLASSRTLADEQKLMRNRRERLIYGFSRDQAAEMASAIRKCGATPSFVVPWKS